MNRFRQCIACLAVLLSVSAYAAEYHVAQSGSDQEAGTAEAPFRTLSKAVAVLRAGDVCTIHAGVYRETVTLSCSGEADKPIRIQAAPGERVIVTATEPFTTSWTGQADGGYVARITPPPMQLFFDGQMAREAHWPNGAYGDLMDRPCLKAEEGTGYEKLVCKDLPEGDFNGGYALIWRGGAWTNVTARIKDYRAGESLAFDPPFEPHSDQYHKGDAFKPKAGNRFLLVGSLAALDAPGEWFVDPGTGLTHFVPPPGKSPANFHFEAKARDTVLALRGCSHVEIAGIELFGGTFDLTDVNHCLLENVRSFYSNHFTRTARKVPDHPVNRISGDQKYIARMPHCLHGRDGTRRSGRRNTR